MLNCSIGIMAYNEEQNIAQLLEAIQKQKLGTAKIHEIIVVASGCTDKTADIVADFSRNDSRTKLLVQEKREGKSSAINYYLKNAHGDIIILESADTIPEKDTMEKLILPFQDSAIGMTGAHPVPIDNPAGFMGFAVQLLWKLHHCIALKEPKMGETVAFRNIIKSIPENSAVDEASIEAEITKNGYRTAYVPEAIIKNKGAETIADFIRQRRRIHSGHLWLKDNFDHQVSTMDGFKIFCLLVKNLNFSLKEVMFTPCVIIMEIWGRFLGWYDFRIMKKNPQIWEISHSTKNLSAK